MIDCYDVELLGYRQMMVVIPVGHSWPVIRVDRETKANRGTVESERESCWTLFTYTKELTEGVG